MKQRGKQSASALAMIVPTHARLVAPTDLPENQRVIWQRVVENRPIDWFNGDHLEMLRCYVRHMAYADTLGQALDLVKPEWLADPERLSDYNTMYRMHERETKAAGQWAMRMRLTQQSIDKRVAGRKLDNFEPGQKPWQQKTA